MADDQNKIPGISEPIQEPMDPMTSDDPQAAVAAQGMQQAYNSAPVQGALEHIDQNLKAQDAMLKAAAAGDPAAMQALAEHSLGMAMMGSLHVPNAATIGETIQGAFGGGGQGILPPPAAGVANRAGAAQELMNTIAEAPAPTQAQLAAAVQRNGAEMAKARPGFRPKRFADGGEVDINDAFSKAFAAPEAQAAAAAPAPETQAAGGPVNVLNPEGKLVSIDSNQLPEALNAGYTQATDEHVHAYMQDEKYGSPLEQAKTALEGAAEGATFGLSTGVERGMLGVKPEDIRGRRETNPGVHMLGQGAGLAASSAIPGLGEANVLSKAGVAGAEALGLGVAETAMQKIGSTAAKMAVENAMVQGGDEVSKMLSQDPHQSVQTAITDIGLAGLLGAGGGAAFGAIPPLWKAVSGGQIGKYLEAVSNKAGGIDGVVPDSVHTAIETAGLNVSPEIKAALSGDPNLQHMFQTLQESASHTGIKAQTALKEFKNQASDAVVGALGKTPEEVANLTNMSEYETGQEVKKSLIDRLKSTMDPINEKYEGIKNQFKSVELTPDLEVPTGTPKSTNPYKSDFYEPDTTRRPGTITKLTDNLASIAQEKGWATSKGSPEFTMYQRMLKELPELKTLEDLRNYQSIVGDDAFRQQMWDFRKTVTGAMRNAEEETLADAMAVRFKDTPEVIEAHGQARAAYKDAMTTIDTLNDRLHVGKFSGPKSFMYALKEMSPEDVLRRLSPKGDAGIISELSSKFPEASQQVRDHYLNNALKSAASRANPGEAINSKVFISQLDKMSPEMRSYLVSPEADAKIKAIQSLLDGVPAKMNNSGTAKTLDSLWDHIPSSAAGIISMLSGHNIGTSILVTGVAKALGNVPDAVRLGLLKFMGSGKQIESEGFKTMVDFIQHTVKGENLTAKATKAIFKAGAEVLPQSQMPTERDREKLDKHLKSLQTNPDSLYAVGGKTSHYLPDQGMAIGQTAATAVNYLNSVRPNTSKASPLDTERKITPAEKSAYDQALNIAQQPLVVLDKIKNGTLTPQNVQAMRSMYPALYSRISQKLTSDMVTHIDKGETIPYKTRLGLSMFLGQAMDSTMTPQGIMAAQASQMTPPAPQGQESGGTKPPSGSSMKGLSKLPGSYQTANQTRQARAQKD